MVQLAQVKGVWGAMWKNEGALFRPKSKIARKSNRQSNAIYIPFLEALEHRVVPDRTAFGPHGVYVYDRDDNPPTMADNTTPLTGLNQAIGEVEAGRPGERKGVG